MRHAAALTPETCQATNQAPQPGTIVADTDHEHLSQQVAWILSLRWLAVVGVFVMAFTAYIAFAAISTASLAALTLTALAMLAYNTWFSRLPPADLGQRWIPAAQVFLDLGALTVMLYVTGGPQNPFVSFYIFHVVIGGILLQKRQTYVVAAGTCVLFGILVLLHETELVPSALLLAGASLPTPIHQSRGWVWVAAILVAFNTTVACTAYFTTNIMHTLRGHTARLLEASDILLQERSKLDKIARNLGAAMLILSPKGRILWTNDIAASWFGSDVSAQSCFRQLLRIEDPCRGCPGGQAEEMSAHMREHSFVLEGVRRHFLVSCSPVRGADKCVEQILTLIQDTTAVRELEGQLRQAGKMVAVGQLATGIAHEISNPLAIVSSSTEILADFADSPACNGGAELLGRHLKKIDQSVYRCKGIIQDLLGFARRDIGKLEEVNLNDVLDETLDAASDHARAHEVEIVRDYALEDRSLISSEYDRHVTPLQIRTRPRELQQVLLNLVVNAIDATQPGGAVTISAKQRGEHLAVSVADTGEGIAANHLDRIFEPFFTTKPIGKGTGLGLYLSHQLVTALGGTLTAENRQPGGAAFHVTLPCSLATT
jgi:signal transduction histidine kinase